MKLAGMASLVLALEVLWFWICSDAMKLKLLGADDIN
jgi:hypothetical protein